MTESVYEFKGIGFQHRAEKGADAPYIIKDLSFSIEKSQRWAIIGPSGCGKSTLLHLMAGLLTPAEGTLLYEGTPLIEPVSSIQIILQEYGLFPWKTVHQNIELPLVLANVSKDRRDSMVDKMLAQLNMTNQAQKAPFELSGGQRQRIAIGRAMITEPEVLLMDEPFSALDALTRESLQQTVLRLSNKKALTTVLVTHQIEEAVLMANRLLVFPAAYHQPLILSIDDSVRDDRQQFMDICQTLRTILKEASDAI